MELRDSGEKNRKKPDQNVKMFSMFIMGVIEVKLIGILLRDKMGEKNSRLNHLIFSPPLHRPHKRQERRRRPARPGLHLRMELRSEEEGMLRYLADLHQLTIPAGEYHPLLLYGLDIGGIDLIAVPVPLHDICSVINPVRQAALQQMSRIISQPHARPHLPDLLLLGQ